MPPIRDVDGVACTRRPPASSCRTRRTSTTVALANTFLSAAVLSSSSSSSLAHAPRLCPTVVARTPVAATVAQPARDTITSPHWPSAQPRTRPSARLALSSSSAPCRQLTAFAEPATRCSPTARQRPFAPIVDTALLARPVQHTRRPDSTAMLRAATHEPVLSLHLVVADLAADNLAPAARPHTTQHVHDEPSADHAAPATSIRVCDHEPPSSRHSRPSTATPPAPTPHTAFQHHTRHMPTLAAHAARRHEPPTQKSTKQTPAHAAASNFRMYAAARVLVDALLAHHRRRRALVDAANARRTGGALRGGTRPTARRPHGIAINISSFSPRRHTRQHNRSIVNFDFFLLAPHLDMSDDEIVLDGTKGDGTVKQKRVKRVATDLFVRFSFLALSSPHVSPARRSSTVYSSSPCPTTSGS